MLNLPTQPMRTEMVRLAGGLDLETPVQSLKPGVLRDSVNFEAALNGGYARIEGYERFDGRPSPSAAEYDAIRLGSPTVAVGNTIVGGTSAATGVVVELDGNIVRFTKATGAFLTGEDIKVGGITVSMVASLSVSSLTLAAHATTTNLAADVYRADILAPPGQGGILGGAMLGGVTYVWRRDAAAATTMSIYKSSTGGWVLVPMFYEVAFTLGTAAYAEGASITQGGDTATVKRVVLQSGTWAGGTAAGRLIITAPAPSAFAAGLAAGGGGCTLSGAETLITMTAAGAHVETDQWNFGLGHRLYGVDGVNRGFEFDGTVYVPLATGASPDVPTRVAVFGDCLLLGFDDNIQYSAIGDPYNWTVIGGAGEIALGAPITVMMRQQGNQSAPALSAQTETMTEMFYGVPGSATFQRIPYAEAAGAKPFTGQRLSQSFALDDSGVMSLVTSQNYGNFDAASLTIKIKRFIDARRNLAVGSVVARGKSQYRVLFSDNWALFITVANGKLLGCMPILLGHTPTCSWHGDDGAGGERMFFGASNGMVYQADKGTSFDGDAIDWYAALTWGSQGNDTVRKRYMRAVIEAQCPGYAEMTISHELSYRSDDIPASSRSIAEILDGNGLVWDSGSWDSGYIWDGRAVAPIRVPLEGTGDNISLTIAGNSDKVVAHTLNSVTYHYIPRRATR